MPNSNTTSTSSSKVRNFLKGFTVLGSFVVLTGVFVIVSILNQGSVAPTNTSATSACPSNLIVTGSTPPGTALAQLFSVSGNTPFDILPANIVNNEPVLNNSFTIKMILPDGTSRMVPGNLVSPNGPKVVFNKTTDVVRQEMLTQNGTYIFRAVSGTLECGMARVTISGLSGTSIPPMVQDKDGWIVDAVGSCQNMTDNSGNVVTNTQGNCSKKVVQNGSVIQRVNQATKCDGSVCPAKVGNGATCTNIKPYYISGASDGHGATTGDYYCQDRQTASGYDHPQNVGFRCDGTTSCLAPIVVPPTPLSSITVCASSASTGCTAGYVGTSAEDAAAKLKKAIADLADGGTITVKNGIYKNAVCTKIDEFNSSAYYVAKNLTIIGESQESVIFDLSMVDCKVGIYSDKAVALKNFTIKGSTLSNITFSGSANSTIENLKSSNTVNGVSLGRSSILSISKSILTNNSIGLWITDTSQANIVGNFINNNSTGIKINSIVGANNNVYNLTVKQNEIKNNTELGILCIDEGNARIKTTLSAESVANVFAGNKINYSSQNGMCPGVTESSLTAVPGNKNYTVGGRVLDAGTGIGYKDLTVTLKSPNVADKTVQTDSQGYYIFVNLVNAGDQYSVELTPPANSTVNPTKNSADTTTDIGWTYRVFENTTTKRDTRTTDAKYEFQKAGENDCAGLRNGVVGTTNRCNFTVVGSVPVAPQCTTNISGNININGNNAGVTTVVSGLTCPTDYIVTHNFGTCGPNNAVVLSSNSTSASIKVTANPNWTNNTCTYSFKCTKTGATDLVCGTKTIKYVAQQENPEYVLSIPAQTNNTATNRYLLRVGESLVIEMTKNSTFSVAPTLAVYNNDNEYSVGNPKPVKYNNSDVSHAMSQINETKYVRLLKFEEVCVVDQNWNNQRVVNVQINGLERAVNDPDAVRWLKCEYPTPTPTLPVCTRSCEKDSDCIGGKVCQETGSTSCNPVNGKEQMCVAPVAKTCIKTGCNGEICSDRNINSVCQYKGIYACYQNAECKVQTDGQCGWTQTQTLLQCLGQEVTQCSKYDLNKDGKVDIFNDFLIFIQQFGKKGTYPTDFNSDQVVDVKDFLLFKEALYKYIETKSCML